MHRLVLGSQIILVLGVLGLSDVAYPCSTLRAKARLDTVTRPCPDGNGGNLETTIYAVSGTTLLRNRRATPTLASFVVELQAREGKKYVPVARQVLNELGSASANTCRGTFTAGPAGGEIRFVDMHGDPLTFAQVKNLPQGTVALNFVATFQGPIPELGAGERARVKVYTTAIGVDGRRTCTVDADGDGSNDLKVGTLTLQKTVRVPIASTEAAPDSDIQCAPPPRCGDGLVNQRSEECDDGNSNDSDACKNDCTPNVCGDGVVRTGVEQCDDGNANQNDACKNDCTPNVCGDGVVRVGVELCDDGNANENDACKNDCTPNVCGDGFVQTGIEQCDDRNIDQCDGCTTLCIFTPLCGDGVVECSEQCDDGNHSACDGCFDCKPESCGDGHICTPEQCDDDNTNDHDACKNDCTPNVCGDGVLHSEVEQCDDGNSDDNDACKNDCTPNVCGDGVVRTDVEKCDDGNADEFDGCTTACTLTPECGNGIVDSTEDCDDGKHDPCDGCSPDCKLEGCGDGIICPPEQCEPPGSPGCDVTCSEREIPGGTLCTLTQGAYGAKGGAANGKHGLITNNPGVLPASVGTPGDPPSVTVNNQASLIAFMPTGGTPNHLCGNEAPPPCPGNLVIDAPGDVPDPSGSGSKGYGGGVLTGQTLALTLSVKLSDIGATPSGLSSLPIPDEPFCTCAGDGKAGPFSVPASVTNVVDTVADLIALANQALGGMSLTPPLTHSDINDALAAINEGFDECRELCNCH